MDTLRKKLISMGYQHCEAVEGAGQFSIRGAIVDIFSAQAPQPYRMEFWDEEVDTISFFDPQTQRRTESVSEMMLIPAKETLCPPEELAERIRSHAKHYVENMQLLQKNIFYKRLSSWKMDWIWCRLINITP